jgi:hypothetical protein
MRDSTYIAIDLGAGSGRVFMANLSPEQFLSMKSADSRISHPAVIAIWNGASARCLKKSKRV